MGTYVVTGAAGYIGSVLCKKLKEHGHKVISVDLKPNKPKYADMHLEETFEHPAVTHTIIDRQVDGIFHLGHIARDEPYLGPCRLAQQIGGRFSFGHAPPRQDNLLAAIGDQGLRNGQTKTLRSARNDGRGPRMINHGRARFP